MKKICWNKCITKYLSYYFNFFLFIKTQFSCLFSLLIMFFFPDQDLSIATADKNGSCLILANDPDVDRLAVAEKLSKYVSVLIIQLIKKTISFRQQCALCFSSQFSLYIFFISGKWYVYNGNEIGALLGSYFWKILPEEWKQKPGRFSYFPFLCFLICLFLCFSVLKCYIDTNYFLFY